jgi:hypothetical protein
MELIQSGNNYVASIAEDDVEDINIVIAHRGHPMGLWATITSCIEDLRDSGISYRFVIVINGETVIPDATKQLLSVLEKGKIRDLILHAEPLSPPTARQMGTESCKGKYIFFFDNHCLVRHGYFKRAIESMEKYGADVLHSSTCYYAGDQLLYHYPLGLHKNFWADDMAEAPVHGNEPYKIAMGGHGGFIVRRATWEEVGGYGPIMMFVGWGGEEPYFDLKAWMFGKTVWLDPQLVHYHYADTRSYSRHHSDDYYRNLMLAAHLIGGVEWLNTVYESFCLDSRREDKTVPMFELFKYAYDRGLSHHNWIARHQKHSLDELLEYFKTNNVAH